MLLLENTFNHYLQSTRNQHRHQFYFLNCITSLMAYNATIHIFYTSYHITLIALYIISDTYNTNEHSNLAIIYHCQTVTVVVDS